jgi:predicted ATPase/DNA-binding SARP family transcriptional activator
VTVPVPDPAAAPLCLRLFGSFEVRRHGALLAGVRARRGHWLLTLLALRHGGPVERAWVAGTLWPDSPEPLAFRSLRSSLVDLRLALGPDAGRLRSPTTHTLSLDLSGTDVDLLAFDAAIARGDLDALAEAVALYRGPLLEECAEGWILAERQAREEAYLIARERLAAHALGVGDVAAAERHLRRAVAVDPLRETAQRALMQALAAGGNYGAALLAYRELRLRLHRELNAEPDAETRALFQRLRAEARAKAGGEPGLSATGRSPSRPLAPSRNLPLPLTSFIGRENQIAEIERWLAAHRLVTLTGAGGCGKSRLALQVATRMLDQYPEGVWLVELAPLTDPALLPQTVATALGVRESPGQPITQTLVEYLRPQELLLLLDNCEHQVSACAHLVEALLRGCPDLRILTTSREALAVGGERAYRVPPLSLPDAQRRLGLEELIQSEAVRLFIERATAAQPAFRMTAANAPVVAEVCRRLDGLPLAIELAAARVNVLSVEQFAARMADLLRLLTGGRRTALPHQRTLRATLDWSYALLSDPERALLRRLSVFAGGSTLEAAEAVGADDDRRPLTADRPQRVSAAAHAESRLSAVVRPDDVLDLLTGLVEKSMVVAEPAACETGNDTEVRYRLLETVRQYAQERLVEAGETEAARERHLAFFLRLAEKAELGLQGPKELEWVERLDVDHDNLRAALEWSRPAPRRLAEGLRIAGALRSFWFHRGYWREGWTQIEDLLAREEAKREHDRRPELLAARAKALIAAGWVGMALAPHETRIERVAEAHALYEQLGDRQGLATALWSLGAFQYGRAPATARAFLNEGLGLFRELGNRWGIAWCLTHLGATYHVESDLPSARRLLAEAIMAAREAGCPSQLSVCLNHLGIVWEKQGDLAAARACFEEALALTQHRGERSASEWSLRNLGRVASAQGDHAAARVYLAEAVTHCWRMGHRTAIAEILQTMARDAMAQGHAARAARLFGAVDTLREEIGASLSPADREEHERLAGAARVRLGEEAFAAAWAAGRGAPPEGWSAFEEALAHALEESDAASRDGE